MEEIDYSLLTSVDPLSDTAFKYLLENFHTYTEGYSECKLGDELEKLELLFRTALKKGREARRELLYKAKKKIETIEKSYFTGFCPTNFRRYIKTPVEYLYPY